PVATPATPAPGERAPAPRPAATPTGAGVELLVGAGRERRLLERIAQAPGALVIVPDVEAAARGAQRLGKARAVLRRDARDDGAPGAGTVARSDDQRHARHPATRAPHAAARPGRARDTRRRPARAAAGEPAGLIAGLRRVR